jgi:invasion protein IalB
LAALAAVTPAGDALAQAATKPAAAAPSPVPEEPAMTTASFGDWIVRCERTGPADKPVRVCEVMQTIQVQGQSAPIAQVALGRVATNEPMRATVILPTNIALPGNVRITVDEKDEQGFDLAWRRCVPGGCVAEANAEPETIKRWRGRAEPGRIVYLDAGGRAVTIQLSFRGLAQALDAFAKEPR